MIPPALTVRGLTVGVDTTMGGQTIVDDVSFDLAQGEVLGLVGESGSGKSMTCRAIMGLLPGTRLSITAGSIILQGERELVGLNETAMRLVRGASIGMIFQNPSSHLDPVMTIGGQIMETVRHHRKIGAADAKQQAIEILGQVGIPDPQQRINNYPHEFSGGMRQRAMIAVALACDPQILIADEPTTALDVTVQAQILRLLLDLRASRNLSIILITHDLGVVSQVCDTVAVMYAGRLCELGPKRDVIHNPRHPYTAGLIDCQPSGGRLAGPVNTIPGQPPRQRDMPAGCRFHPRCTKAGVTCNTTQPSLEAIATNHLLACHFPVGAAIREPAREPV